MTTAAELDAIAAKLITAATAIEHHIAAKAQKLANKLAAEYAKAAREQVEAANGRVAVEIMRRHDDAAEFENRTMVLRRRDAQYTKLEANLDALIAAARNRGEPIPADVLLNAIARAQRDGYATDTRGNQS